MVRGSQISPYTNNLAILFVFCSCICIYAMAFDIYRSYMHDIIIYYIYIIIKFIIHRIQVVYIYFNNSVNSLYIYINLFNSLTF